MKSSYSKRTCALMIATITAYTALGIYSIYSAYRRYGSDFVSESFMKIWNDPIYTYAVADLGAIFTVAAIYTFVDAKKKGLRSWPWIPTYFVFGTPAFLAYVLYASRHSKRSN